ncbi:MAG TPA: 4Fe-4S dicluster domain-containing protein [Rhodobacterales bacterium]|nr:4Fe-4S dicluster domain-containing protein [Rhodobacterales bacterium]
MGGRFSGPCGPARRYRALPRQCHLGGDTVGRNPRRADPRDRHRGRHSRTTPAPGDRAGRGCLYPRCGAQLVTAKPPVLHAQSCVRSGPMVALCEACATACPTQAITLPPGAAPRIRPEACIGCGACAMACPETAFAPVVPQPDPADWVWALACGGADETSGYCLNAISLADLAAVYLRGIHTIKVVEHDCTACPRAGGIALADTLARFNGFAQERALPPMTLAQKPKPKRGWLARLAGAQASGHDPSRRAALRGGDAQSDTRRDALRSLLAASPEAPARRFPFAPAILPDQCTGCDACARACPTGALQIATAPDGTVAYEIAAEACTGCGWCVALCEDDAITICLDSSPGDRVPLEAFQCRSCKTPAHRPLSGSSTPESLCNICAKKEYSRPDILVL